MAICRALGNGRDKSKRDRPAGSGNASIFGENGTRAEVQELKPTSLRLPTPRFDYQTLRIDKDNPMDEVFRQGRQNIAVGKSSSWRTARRTSDVGPSVSAVQRGKLNRPQGPPPALEKPLDSPAQSGSLAIFLHEPRSWPWQMSSQKNEVLHQTSANQNPNKTRVSISGAKVRTFAIPRGRISRECCATLRELVGRLTIEAQNPSLIF
jgi:hypothetical protein